ncbi:putative oxygen-independent coproporphyrinogen III oxidase [Halobacteriovorax marinus SJ]|uniref:Oxygen-independent coproporphyrinogen III oxidase n=1 Tax=Halobacteriovorax marinus (strain ATCC BAA-682 / DSM 15412 / SJ) TaxID=862908 RepID=E1X0H0_HALMS|nr:coproporphyrinogen-III oxidase family protein [Halobacteriovorax marinus]CBW27996.1 putative oxygen-independent coproporphyrinogen III oxidase [Halobacteriovorax marinus SJ]
MKNHPIESLYIHFPFCRHLCNYCDFYKNIPVDKELEYGEFETSLVEGYSELEQFLLRNNCEISSLNTLYLGGGTPSLWGVRGAEFLKNFLLERNIKLSSTCEFTLEVNPGAWTREALSSWQSSGVNRYSLGIQSLDANFLKVIDRVHSIDDVYETLKFFHEHNLSFSVDFMLGLPFSEKYNRDILKELEEILDYAPEHISLYILTTKAGYIHRDHLPSEEYIEKEYLDVANFLRGKGFDHYEVSNFAKKGKESRHNLQYWRSESVAALGASATGYLKEAATRFKWKVLESKYKEEILTEDELRLEEIYMGLRINQLYDLSLQIEDLKTLEQVISHWEKSSYLKERVGYKLSLNSRGFLLLDSLMNDLFKYKLI